MLHAVLSEWPLVTISSISALPFESTKYIYTAGEFYITECSNAYSILPLIALASQAFTQRPYSTSVLFSLLTAITEWTSSPNESLVKSELRNELPNL